MMSCGCSVVAPSAGRSLACPIMPAWHLNKARLRSSQVRAGRDRRKPCRLESDVRFDRGNFFCHHNFSRIRHAYPPWPLTGTPGFWRANYCWAFLCLWKSCALLCYGTKWISDLAVCISLTTNSILYHCHVFSAAEDEESPGIWAYPIVWRLRGKMSW